MINREPAVGEAISFYRIAKPSYAPTVMSAMAFAFPELRDEAGRVPLAALNQVPISSLFDRLNQCAAGWAPAHAQALREQGFTSDTHQKAYPRFARRMLDDFSLASKDREIPTPLMPAWELLLYKRDLITPRGRKETERYLKAGVQAVAGFDLTGSLDQAVVKINALRSGVNVVANAASEAGLSPASLAEQWEAEGKGKGALPILGNDTIRKQFRRGFNLVVNAFPELGLAEIATFTRAVGLPKGQWPRAAEELLKEAVLDVYSNPESTTARCYEDRLRELFGINVSAGIDIHCLLKGRNGKSACRLMMQGIPTKVLPAHLRDASHLEMAQAIAASPELQEVILAAQQDLMLSHEGQESLASPFVGVARDRRYAEEYFQSFRGLMALVQTLNKNYIKIRCPHVAWIEDWLTDVNKQIQAKPSEYDSKKAEAFQHPEVWAALGDFFEKKLADLMASPELDSRTYRTDLRNALAGLLLHRYPLRIEHYVKMRIKRDFKRETYRIFFPTKETKNKRLIDIEIPDDGTREAIDFYLDLVRPAMLKGASSDYFFVPDHSVPNAGERIGSKGFNKIFEDMSEEWLADILPTDLKILNPHIMRHLAAGYQIRIEKDPGRAAQMLNDALETVLAYYADVLPGAREDLKAYHERRRQGNSH